MQNCMRDKNADLPRRIDQIARRRPQGHRAKRRTHHKRKTRPSRRLLAGKTDRRDLPQIKYSGLVRRHVGKRHRPRTQYSDVHARRLHFARRRFGKQTLLARRHHRTSGGGFCGGHHHRAGTRGIGFEIKQIESKILQQGRLPSNERFLLFIGCLVIFLACSYPNEENVDEPANQLEIQPTTEPTKPPIPIHIAELQLMNYVTELVRSRFPNRDPTITDPIYESLLLKGNEAIPCLVEKIGNGTL